MPEIGRLPEPLNSAPLDLTKHWSILDQTKAEFKKSGRSGVVIIIEPEDAYRAKLVAFLAKFKTTITEAQMAKPQLVLEHETEAEALYALILRAGLRAELILAER